jgi:protein kinase/serine/threonine-protein kinase
MLYFAERNSVAAQSRAKTDTAIELLGRAISLDPDYAEAHAMLGYAYAWTAIFFEDNPTLIARAEEQTRLAEQIDASLSQIHLTRGFILWSWYKGWRIAEAIQEYRSAQEKDPAADMELGAFYAHLGLFDEWHRAAERALELDPTNQQMKVNYVQEHYLYNRPEELLAVQRRLLNTGPDSRYFLLTRQVGEAETMVEQEKARDPTNFPLTRIALLRALQGRHKEAQELVPRILSVAPKNQTYHHITYDLARVFALDGRGAEAARWLDGTVRLGMPPYPMFSADKMLDSVRGTPEMKTVMANLKVQWDRYRAQLP